MTPSELTQDKKDRLSQLVQAATAAFASLGYRRTTMADIARRMGVAPGTVYLYAASKEALFGFLVHWHLGQVDLHGPLELPVRAGSDSATLGLIRNTITVEALLPSLAAALETDEPQDVTAEFKRLLGDVYSGTARHRRFIALIEGSAHDWPEMADLYYRLFRQRFFDDLAEYLRRRIDAGHLPPVPDVAIAARLILETCAWFAMHRHGDKFTPDWPEERVAATVTEMLVRAVGAAPLSPLPEGGGGS